MTMYARACEFLRSSLALGPRRSTDVVAAAEQAGIDYSAVHLAARTLTRGGDYWWLRPAQVAASPRGRGH